MKIGVYGGTFNPPHLGHTAAARSALEALELDNRHFGPAARPPHKELPGGSPAAEQRLEMTEIAADGLLQPQRTEVCALELSRPGKSYTADTLCALRERYPDDELWLLMGSDMFRSLHTWWKPEVILETAGICAFARSRTERADALEAQAASLRERYGARIQLMQIPELVEISSTELRERLAQGEGERFLPPAVYGYILMHSLYHVERDLTHLSDEELRCCSYSMIKAKRIAHVKGTEEEAVRLAARWDVDTEQARRAAILHDCTKYLDMEDQLKLCRKYGILLDDLEQEAVKLLHAKTGAAVARDMFGVPDEIYEAIFWHTTGKADMTPLEKVLYIADYMEPTRDFPGVERLRRLAYEDLDAAVLLGCEMSIQEMAERCLPVHPNTVKARDWLLRTKG